MSHIINKTAINYAMAVLSTAIVTAALGPFGDRINSTTAALALLLVVLFSATLWGSGPAILASVLGMLCFNYFLLPPLHTFGIEEPQNWAALTAFLITALTSIKASVTTLLDESLGKTEDGHPVTLDDESRREMLDVINEESDRLNRFVEDLVELARLEGGRAATAPQVGRC